MSITRGTTNSDIFSKFIQSSLLSFLHPFNGTNPHSVVVMDNCSIHHVREITEDAGAILPPYSPDLNPKVKSRNKDLESSMDNCDTDTIILTAFASISQHDCQQWISQS